VWILNAKYLNLTGRPDSACLLAKKVRLSEGGEAFDLSEFCNDMGKTLDLLKYRKLTYSMGEADFIINLSQFNYSGGIQFNWERGKSFNTSAFEKGKITINKNSLDSAYLQTLEFNADADASLEEKNSTFWLSKAQYKSLKENSSCKLGFGAGPLNAYRVIGHEQVEVFNESNKEVLFDCVVMTDGVNKICYLDDAENPLIVKIESETFNLILTKFQ
jgi:hypothetical protein